jgi:isoquinoline 1-oxidoreductase subunit beta
MEPPVAVADFKDGAVTVWAPTQNPQAVQETVAEAVGIDKSRVTCHVTLLGGGFGRKSKPDYCAEAALLSKRLGTPVKVVWTREDDIRFDYYHSTAAVYHKATVDARGRPTAWLQRSVFPPIAAMFDASAEHAMSMELELGFVDLPYAVPNLRMENGAAAAHVRIGWFRAVANNYHAFAAQCFVDELAHAAGRDPLEFQLDLLGPGRIIDFKAAGLNYENYGAPYATLPFDTGRLRKVLEMAADKAGWSSRKPRKGWGMGLAAHRSFNSYVASVVEVEVDAKGRVHVPRVVQVVDAGVIVNPDRVRSQFEGAAVMAVGMARTGEVSATNGRITQGNFNDYRVARMSDAPVQVDVHMVDSDAAPGGVGEPGVPPVLAALGNAIFAATGTRVRDLPLARHTDRSERRALPGMIVRSAGTSVPASRSAARQHPSGQRVHDLPVAHPRHAVHEHVDDAFGVLVRLEEGGLVGQGGEVEHHQVGGHPFADGATIVEAHHPRRQRGRRAHRVLEADDALLERVVADLAHEAAVEARVRRGSVFRQGNAAVG